MAERPINNEKRADKISMNPALTEEAKHVRVIQKAPTQSPCYKKPEGQGKHIGSCSEKYHANSAEGFDINNWGLPALDLEQYEDNIKGETGVADESKGSICYAWIGAGQCGGRLVKSFYDLGYKKLLAVNTTRRDLNSLDIPQSQKFLMSTVGEENSRDMERGAKAISQHRQDIFHISRRIFGNHVDHIMICFGAGGGAGSGSIVELIDIAKRYARSIGLKNPSKKVGVIMTLPAVGKVGSPLVSENAYKVANELSQMATTGQISPLVIVDNDKINRMYPGIAANALWLNINQTVANMFSFFNKVSALCSRYTSFDPLDYLSIIESGGCLSMGRTKVDKLDNPFAISDAVKNNFKQTLFVKGLDLSSVKVCGCIVVGGKELMANVGGLQENINYAFDVLSDITGDATIHRGIYEDNSNSLKVYTIIGGIDNPTDRLEELKQDLCFRPDIVDIEGLLLRERKEDILYFAEYFLSKEANFYGREDKVLSSDVKKILLHYSWPGNVHELAKAMERAYELTVDREIQADALPFKIIFADSEGYPKHILSVLDKVKREMIIKTIELFHGRKLSAARILGIEPKRLDYLIRKLGIPGIEINTSS
ncbi:MAG: AAA-type ATPase lid domain-containing protein [Planctomycetota bacterium]